MRIVTLALAAVLLAPVAAHAALPVSFSIGPAVMVVGGYTDATIQQTVAITNTGTAPLTLGLERQMVAEVAGSQNNFCFSTGCFPPNVSISPQTVDIAPGAADNSFVGDYQPQGQAGVTTIRYAIYDVNGAGTSADTAYFTIIFDARSALASPKALASARLVGQLAPNPAVSGTDVLLPYTPHDREATPARLEVRDLRDGRLVRSLAVAVGFDGAAATGGYGIAPGGCFPPAPTTGGAPATTLCISTAGLAPGLYGCLLTDARGHNLALRRLVVQ